MAKKWTAEPTPRPDPRRTYDREIAEPQRRLRPISDQVELPVDHGTIDTVPKMKLTRLVAWAMVAVAIAPGCSRQESPPTSSSSPQAASSSSEQRSAAPVPAAETVIQFDPRWMTLDTPASWTEFDRAVTEDFQRFGMRPVDETELPRNCNGCGFKPPTAVLTAYAPGEFDPSEARTGEPVTVSTDGDGFFRAAEGSADAILTWKYADDAWATVRGRTTVTSEPARLTELGRALRPADRVAIRLPLGIPALPASLPLAEISAVRDTYGTTLIFAACGKTDIGAIPDCYSGADNMRVQIWPTDGYYGHIDEQESVPVQIGGRDGLYEPASNRAAVQVQPGTLVVFALSGPFAEPGEPRTKPQSDLKEILAKVTWAANPGDQQTWIPVADWASR